MKLIKRGEGGLKKYFVYDRYKQLMVDVDLNNH